MLAGCVIRLMSCWQTVVSKVTVNSIDLFNNIRLFTECNITQCKPFELSSAPNCKGLKDYSNQFVRSGEAEHGMKC